MLRKRWPVAPVVFAVTLLALQAAGQEKSVRPDINVPFKHPDVKKYVGSFEVESREVFAHRKEIVAACHFKPGMVVADIGAGTGLFTRLIAKEVGPTGKVYAVDIAQEFLDHIAKTCKDQKIDNVKTVRCTQTSSELPAGSIDAAFVCDTYHHFEFPYRTLASIHRALKPGGQLIVIDFKRVKGESSDWIMGHVRAGQDVVAREIREAGFRQVEEIKLLNENYMLRFQKRPTDAGAGK
jgi:predicted methyltransferase